MGCSNTSSPPPDTEAKKARFIQLVEGGYSFAAAAKAVDVNQRTYRRWFTREERQALLRKNSQAVTSVDVSQAQALHADKGYAVDASNPVIQARAFDLLKTQKRTPEQLAASLCFEPERIDAVVDGLRAAGFRIEIEDGFLKLNRSKETDRAPVSRVLDHDAVDVLRFGYVSDTHLCSDKHREDVLTDAYDLFEEEGIQHVFHTGNLVDGDGKFNKNEITHRGATGQAHYALDAYPQRDGITTYFIAADDHEGWWMQDMGLDWGEYFGSLCQSHDRPDLVYVGYMEADLFIPAAEGKTHIRLLHPGAGTSYAVSYRAQKIVEGYPIEEQPDILLLGHYHKNLTMLLRNIYIVYGGSTQDQTRFLRKKAIAPAVGFYILEAFRSPSGRVLQLNNQWHGYRPLPYNKPQELILQTLEAK